MGPGPDGPMGGMGAMEQHHMNGSLGETVCVQQIPPGYIHDETQFFLFAQSFRQRVVCCPLVADLRTLFSTV